MSRAGDAGAARRWSGWLYHNPDTGTELSENHPVRSGECEDAERIRFATREELRDELLSAWRGLREQEADLGRMLREGASDRDRLAAELAEARADAAKARDAALEEAAAWHEAQIQTGHCGEESAEAAARRRANRYHETSAAAIRAARTNGGSHGR